MTHIKRIQLVASSLALCLVIASFTSAQTDLPSQWTQFRGNAGNGTAIESAKPPTQWDEKQLAWEIEIPGIGWSSPVYESHRAWMTTAISTPMSREEIKKKLAGDRMAGIKTMASSLDLHAVCVDLDSGKIVHNIKLASVSEPDAINPLNSYASPTPAIKDGKVICHFGNYGTWCLNEESGKEIWKKEFVVKHSVGPGSSPVIVGKTAIIVCDGTDKQFIVGVDIDSGDQVWKTDRPPIRANDGEFRKAYCTPLLIEVEGKKQAVIPGAQWIASYDPASGKEIWRVDHGKGFSVTPMPVYEAGLVIFSTGYTRPEFVAIDPNGTGDITTTHVVWRKNNAPTMPSFVANGGRIFAISDKGIMFCIDAKTGEELNRDRVGGNFSASPLLAGGNLYLGSREGKMTIMKCSSDLEIVGSQEFGAPIMASPVLVGDDLVVRTEKKLVRIKGSKP